MNWTQEKLEELYKKVNDRAAQDPDFYEKVLKNPKAAMEEVAGCSLPENMGLKYIEKDSSFGGTFVVPDFAEGEIDLTEMRNAAGGVSGGSSACGAYSGQTAQKNNISVALIISICAAAMQIGPDAGACLAAFGVAEACAVELCGAHGCYGNACGGDADIYESCSMDACGADAGGFVHCEVQACEADACGSAECLAEICGAEGGVLQI